MPDEVYPVRQLVKLEIPLEKLIHSNKQERMYLAAHSLSLFRFQLSS